MALPFDAVMSTDASAPLFINAKVAGPSGGSESAKAASPRIVKDATGVFTVIAHRRPRRCVGASVVRKRYRGGVEQPDPRIDHGHHYPRLFELC